MPRYLIESSHTPEECLKALDEVLAQGPEALARYDFGCAVGDHSNHRAYTMIEAANEVAARNILPMLLRGKAQVIEVGKFTPEQIRSFH
jgi:hypothetical protein